MSRCIHASDATAPEVTHTSASAAARICRTQARIA
jgi:hypothetical protein